MKKVILNHRTIPQLWILVKYSKKIFKMSIKLELKIQTKR